jgi:hypothetical protein
MTLRRGEKIIRDEKRFSIVSCQLSVVSYQPACHAQAFAPAGRLLVISLKTFQRPEDLAGSDLKEI